MAPGADGRTYDCPYCGARQQEAIASEQLAQGLKLDLSNVDAFIHQLAHQLHGHFGERTKLRLDGAVVSHFEINLDPDLFVAKREADRVVAQHKKLVRGIALKTAIHPLDTWVQMLTRSLASHANENARVAQVLSQLKGV
jgi:hypothetical protein